MSTLLIAERPSGDIFLALGDAILACLTERPMTGYELAKTFDSSIGFFWKANHQQIYRELTKLRDRGHIQGREVVQSGKPNKLVYTLTLEGRAALRHWAARPSVPASIKDDLLVRLYALDSVDLEPLRADLMARLEHHRDRCARRHGQAALASPRGSSRARRGGMVRRSARRAVGRHGADQRGVDRGRPARKQRLNRPLSVPQVTLLTGHPQSLTRYLP
jgi:DNA-binding PadR family transcriptional regulator